MPRAFLACLTCVFSFSFAALAVEEIDYRLLKQDGDIEIRHYDETVSAEVTLNGERDEVINNAFRILFDYIQGANVSAQEIEMTAPVSQASQEIEMTAPVSQEPMPQGEWAVAFYMPNHMSFETTPKPKDKRVSIHRVPSRKMASITFSGFRSDKNITGHEKELRSYLRENNIEFNDSPLYAFYDAPWVPWFLRRNEVLFALND